MQDTTAGNKNAGKVMRKKTPRELSIPNENADHDTVAWSQSSKNWQNPSVLELDDRYKTTADEHCFYRV